LDLDLPLLLLLLRLLLPPGLSALNAERKLLLEPSSVQVVEHSCERLLIEYYSPTRYPTILSAPSYQMYKSSSASYMINVI
jgi:hypothetical protein